MGRHDPVLPPNPIEKRKSIRRGKRKSQTKHCNFTKCDNKWILLHSNIRGYNSKKLSFKSIVEGVNPNIITLNEVAFRKDKKLNLPGFLSYNKNRQKENMGGVATCIRNDEKAFALKTDEGEDKDEFIITRHNQFIKPINVVNIYGEVESRSSIKEVDERWSRIMEKLEKIKANNEWVILIGDLNKLVGNGKFGVKGNHDKVSHGGKLIHKLLESENYNLVNNTDKCVNGPFTRYDPGDPLNEKKMSCLELVIVDKELCDYIEELYIDKHKKFTPHRPVRKQKLCYTDHFSIILTFKDIPLKKWVKCSDQKSVSWNLHRKDGWKRYQEMTEDNQDLVKLLQSDEDNSTELAKKIDSVMTKIKFKAFGKVTINDEKKVDKDLTNLYLKRKHLIEEEKDEQVTKVEESIAEKLLDRQRSEYEEKLKNLNELKANKGNQAALFKLKAKITGDKKGKQEAVSMTDPETGEMLFEPENIRDASANYLSKLLTNREPSEGYERDIKVKEVLHDLRMAETKTGPDDIFDEDDFGKLLKNLKKKNKEKYQFILKAGTDFLRVLYSLFKKTWESGRKPKQWEKTTAHQLYKGKGKATEFKNQRFIHTKDQNPKAFEHVLMEKAKPRIINGCTKYQIGALPKHRSQEHLFTLKSIIAWYIQIGKPLLLTLYDISKFFDREMLKDAMDALYRCGIVGKLYRMIFEMNKRTVLTIKTGCGMTQPVEIGATIAQGSIGGALISSVNLDSTVNLHFSKSEYELSYMDLRLQPTIFQDDLSRLSSDRESAQAGNVFITSCMESKLMDLNVDKSCYIIIGSIKNTPT